PTYQNIEDFFEFHPCQPKDNIPFNHQKAYYSTNNKRIWLSYSTELKKLFCTICIAYGKKGEKNTFVEGSSDWQHIYLRIGEHENSAHHRDCVNSHFMTKEGKDIKKMIIYGCTDVRGKQIERRRNIVERIVDVVKLIGKCGLAYRGKRNEAAYTLNNPNVDHGNFLEIILFLSKYDSLLKSYLDEIIAKSEKIKDKGSKQGGGLITFLSKNTFNSILEVCSDLITETIVSEIKKARMYSLQIDTTQDVSVSDQCSIIIRYVNDKVYERIIGFKKCTTTTGQAFADLVVQTLQSKGISLNNCIGNSTDGASNMQGQYSGFAKKMEDLVPNQVHVWCVGHILNLVLQDVTSSEMHAANLFELLNSTASFIRRSHVRMDRWNDIVTKMKLNLIGETRWWAKEVALKKIFGLFDTNNFNGILFKKLIQVMKTIKDSVQNDSESRAKASGFIENFIKYETVLTAMVFLKIFSITGPLSKYLQGKNCDILQAYNMIKKSEVQLQQVEFSEIHEKTNIFIEHMNEELDEIDIIIESEFPNKRRRVPKKMFNYEADDSFKNISAIDEYRIGTFKTIMDTINNKIKVRYGSLSREICADISCLDPKNFEDIKKEGLPENAMKIIGEKLNFINPNVTQASLKEEFLDFVNKFDSLKQNISFSYVNDNEDIDDSDGFNLDEKEYSISENASYSSLFLAYKYILTLSISQVSCERSFSKLKYIKNRLRSTLSSSHLEQLMIICTEKDILNQLENNTIIDKF
ncbi:zinc finger MYM-type protein 6-like, partial [Aphis craccivora]